MVVSIEALRCFAAPECGRLAQRLAGGDIAKPSVIERTKFLEAVGGHFASNPCEDGPWSRNAVLLVSSGVEVVFKQESNLGELSRFEPTLLLSPASALVLAIVDERLRITIVVTDVERCRFERRRDGVRLHAFEPVLRV